MHLFKRIYAGIATVPLFVYSVVCFSVPMEASAYTVPTNTIELTSAQTVALFGTTIQGKYQTTPDGVITYEDCTFTYAASHTISSGSYYSPYGQDLIGRTVCYYKVGNIYPSTNPESFILSLDTSVSLSSVTYVDTGAVFIRKGAFDWQNLFISQDPYKDYYYWFCTSGNSVYRYRPYVRGSDSGENLYYASLTDTASNKIMVSGLVWTGSSGTFNLGNIYSGVLNYDYIGIVCPIISTSFNSSDGGNGSDDGRPDTESSGGSGESGGGSVDLTETNNKLSAILSKLDEIANKEGIDALITQTPEDSAAASGMEQDAASIDSQGNALVDTIDSTAGVVDVIVADEGIDWSIIGDHESDPLEEWNSGPIVAFNDDTYAKGLGYIFNRLLALTFPIPMAGVFCYIIFGKRGNY